MATFNPPSEPIVSELTVCVPLVTSNTPPLTVTMPLPRAPAAANCSVPAEIVVLPL